MKVIELCGKAGVGKDTFGNELITQLENRGYTCIHIAFADRLKDICKHYFHWDGQKDTKGRDLLQKIGTDVFRQHDEDFWVKEVCDFLRVCNSCDLFDYAIITDARFPNEITRLKEYGFDVMAFRILRNNFVSKLNDEEQNHKSEIALDDFNMEEINLSGDLKMLEKEVGDFIIEWIL
ncbi:MAG: hypothetical protein J6T10_32470 [Methanobrevibacter sp.]|nr:hypothetical protein [Methanobrevibacter sp.]